MGVQRSTIIFTVVALLFAKVALRKIAHANSPILDRQSALVGDSCQDKEKCVVLYVAPWCPVCERTLPVALEIGKRWSAEDSKSNAGLRILVGADRPEKCLAKAEKIGPIATVDEQGQFGKRYGINAYPTWIVFDSTGHELNRVSAGFYDSGRIDLFVHSMLKL